MKIEIELTEEQVHRITEERSSEVMAFVLCAVQQALDPPARVQQDRRLAEAEQRVQYHLARALAIADQRNAALDQLASAHAEIAMSQQGG